VVEETPQTVSFDFLLLCWMKQKRKEEEEEDGVAVARGRECTRYI
jgi:hypothetical protein